MKTSALAALAVVSAASAQSSVTISGKLRYAYENISTTTAGTEVKTSGIKRTDGDLVFTAVEDLGGGLKATANMAIQTGARSTAAGNRDGNLFLSGGFGTVAVGSIDAGNGIYALGGAGAGWLIGLDSAVLTDTGNIDYMSYTSPAISGFAFKAQVSEVVAADALAMGSTSATQDDTTVGVTYSNGPLSAAADTTTYGDNAATTDLKDGRTRLSAKYNLGVATVGIGYETRDAKATLASAALTTKDTIIGVLVPMGAFDLAANYATSKTDNAGFTVKGYEIGARYNLSKRTYAVLTIQNIDTAANSDLKTTRIQLAHSF